MNGIVYYNDIVAGTLRKEADGSYTFRYTDEYFLEPTQPSISLTLRKNRKEHHSDKLFAFFAGLLAEGINKETQCKLFRIDENDDFTRLLLTAGTNTAGAITVKPEAQ